MQELKGMATGTEAGRAGQAPDSLAAAMPGRRRITADSFRLLTARLKSRDVIPDLFAPAPPPELQPVEAVEFASFPAFEPEVPTSIAVSGA